MAVTDREAARAQWLGQVKVIRKSERRIARAMAKAYTAGLDRWISAGTPDIPQDAKRAIVSELSRMWLDAAIIGGRMAIDGDKGAYPKLETKQEEITLFERIMMDFVQRFGAVKVQRIVETTRNQLVRMIDKGIADGLGQEAIAKMITDSVPTFSRTRARVIARTEVHTAALYSSQEVAKTSPFPMNKRWISVFDARTRDFGEGDGVVDQANHRVMNEVTVGPEELFAVPNSAMGFDLMAGPGDPGAPAYQVINCRCSLIYRRVGRPWPKEGEA